MGFFKQPFKDTAKFFSNPVNIVLPTVKLGSETLKMVAPLARSAVREFSSSFKTPQQGPQAPSISPYNMPEYHVQPSGFSSYAPGNFAPEQYYTEPIQPYEVLPWDSSIYSPPTSRQATYLTQPVMFQPSYQTSGNSSVVDLLTLALPFIL